MIKRYLKRSLLCLAFMFTILVPTRLNAEVIEIEPLFEYPVAPEEIISLSDKSNWLMQHFWDNMDFKKKDAVNQSALNDAFRVFTLPMQWADKTEVDKATAAIADKEKRLKEVNDIIKEHAMKQFREGDKKVEVKGSTYTWTVSRSETTTINKKALEADGLLEKYQTKTEQYRMTVK